MPARILADLAEPGGWLAIAPGDAELKIHAEAEAGHPSLSLEFDFHGGGGFVVARKPLALSLPDDFAVEVDIRGIGPPNTLEVKLVDPSNTNVWRYQERELALTPETRTLHVPGSAIDFAWGPAGGGAPRELGAVEIGLVAGPGGRGRLSISGLRLLATRSGLPPLVHATSAGAGHPAAAVLDGTAETSWRASGDDPAPCLTIDFQEPREYGGVAIQWADAGHGRAFALDASDDGERWRPTYQAVEAAGRWNLAYLPNGGSRCLRLQVSARDGRPAPAVVTIETLPRWVAKSVNEWFHSLAQRANPGRYPRWLSREQTYWTPFAGPDGSIPALLNEDGMVEVEPAGFSIEPFVYSDGALMGWAEVEATQALARGELPIPSVIWPLDALSLTVTAFAAGSPGATRPMIRYRLQSRAERPRRLRLLLAVRPFQVCPPWQAFGAVGGVSPVRHIAYRDGALWVNEVKCLRSTPAPDAAGVATYDQGPITDYLARGALPAATEASDGFGYASGALAFDLELPAAGEAEVYLACGDVEAPLPSERPPSVLLAEAEARWASALDSVGLDLPAPAQAAAGACRSAIAHILINRDGPALQPGPRRYTRSWIRDGAVMAAALLRWGRPAEAGAFIRWYAGFQRADGNVPCCVDRQGVDWLAEHDSHGELIFAVADYLRFTGDLGLAKALWPAVQKAVGFLERLRVQRLTDDFLAPDRRARYGLLPESVSHEGYLAQPVHAYWDDFWALRGLKDAAWLAGQLGEAAESARLAALSDDFRSTLLASIERTMTERGIDYLPGSVEWADADPTAVANALTLIDEAQHLPPAALNRTFDRFLERFRAMHGGGAEWTNYTPYEIRIIGALVRLGRRDQAHELLDFYLAERRPPAWNQWPEIAWRDPRTPGHQGDLPHAWIGAEYALVFRDLFVFEREADGALVVAAGVPARWLAAGAIGLSGLPTAYGRLDLQIDRRPDACLTVRLSGDLHPPPGGIRVVPPGVDRAGTVWVNGVRLPHPGTPEILVTQLPAELILSAHG